MQIDTLFGAHLLQFSVDKHMIGFCRTVRVGTSPLFRSRGEIPPGQAAPAPYRSALDPRGFCSPPISPPPHPRTARPASRGRPRRPPTDLPAVQCYFPFNLTSRSPRKVLSVARPPVAQWKGARKEALRHFTSAPPLSRRAAKNHPGDCRGGLRFMVCINVRVSLRLQRRLA